MYDKNHYKEKKKLQYCKVISLQLIKINEEKKKKEKKIPWTERRSNQSILNEINPECWLEVMWKLKLQYFGHLMWRAESLEKTLMLGKIEGRWRRGQQRTKWLDGINSSLGMSLSKLWEMVRTGKPGMLQSIVSQRVGHDWATEQLQNT